MRKSWFNRLLLSYMPVFIIVITFVFFVFFQVFSEQSRKEALKSNEMLSLQAMQLIDTSLKAIDNTVLREIASSEDLRTFFKSNKEGDPFINIRAVSRMKDMINYNPLIDSIYLVRYTDSFVLSNATQGDMKDFSDHSFIEQIQDTKTSKWTDTRMYQPFGHMPAKQVVSLVRGAHFLNEEQGIIVVNVGTDSLKRMTQDLFKSQVGFIQVKDQEGRLLFSNGADSSGTKAQSIYVSSYSGWNYESGFIHGGLMRMISSLSSIWFVTGLIMIGLGMIWMVYVTRRNSKPIEQIVDRFSSYSLPILNGSEKRMDEFAFISSALDNIMEQSLQYQKQYKEDMHLRTRNLFHQLIDGNTVLSWIDWKREAEKLQLPTPKKTHRIIIVEIDKYGEFCSHFARQDQNLLKFAVRTVVQEILMKDELQSWSEWISSSQLAVIVFEPEKGIQDIEIFERQLDQIRAWTAENLKFTVTISIGDRADEIQLIPSAFQSAKYALKYKYVLGENRLIWSDDLATEGQAEAYAHLGDIRAIIQLLRKSDESWKDAYHSLFHNLKQGLLTNDDIEHLLDYFIYNLNRECSSMNKELQACWSDDILPAMNDIMDSGYTLEFIHDEMYAILMRLSNAIVATQETNQHATMIREMSSFIEREFANPNMSLDYLSEQYHINPKYVSKLFKENTGQKFVDFLIDIRMNEAKRLLLNTNHNIQEIAEQVGYLNAISFSRVFKKVMGSSPSDYRSNAAKRA
ncbi:AraC family transcriptional regulator [Paenibacillus sp. 1001270B_150601_E10]|uniref:AraC family transcriptional regulator n=1 Tax=Paenibacillus sp. 1001270B_150601_E10 TaxID=2787079 RepID=UPI00189CB3C1|nr:cache domain-containing protein [Paenibacillus sp. 1001270B_150601_E10]